MNTKSIPTNDPTLHFIFKTSNKTTTNPISTVSFNIHPTQPLRTRSTTRIRSTSTEQATETLYQVLGISETCESLSSSDIKKAYKQMARKYHPDVSSPDQVDEHTKRFIMVQQAYETLSDPRIRASYDRDLANGVRSAFSTEIYHQYNNQRKDGLGEWKTKLDELKERSLKKKSSWGSRIRSKNNAK